MIKESGQILVVVFVALGVMLFSVLFIVGGAQIYYQNATYSTEAEKATALAEAGIDKAVASLNKTGGSYNGESETNLGDGSYSVVITSKDTATKIIESTGYIPNKTSPRVRRAIKIETSSGVGISFVYGVQVGEGGLQLGHGNSIIGSIYSNGNVAAEQNNSVTGDVWVAGGPQASPDQQTDCTGGNCTDFLFGKNISGENRLDVAQSFKPQATNVINKISLKIKKIGNPSDATVRILGDSGGSPNKNNVLATGTLYSSLVSTNYSFIDVTFTSTPNLIANTIYWIMIDTSSNSANYWSWQNDLAQSYTNGSPQWSGNWSATNPTWTSFSGDLSFKTTMGGNVTSITASSTLLVSGHVHANTIQNLNIAKDAYYKTLINTIIGGQSYPDSNDPPPLVFPISDANITDWKNQSQAVGVTVGNITNCVQTLGPGKIVGNITWGNGCVVVVKSPVWITGNLTVENDTTFKLDPSFGTTSGFILVDGKVDFKNNNKVQGSGTGNSILMILSTYDSRSNNEAAITIKNNGNTGIFYANIGIIEPGSNNQFKELTAWGIRLVNNSTLTYETGLSSTLFSSGPSGSYSLIKGTYQVK